VFQTHEGAVRALNDAVAKENLDEVMRIFGPDGKELLDSSDPATARRNRQLYTVAIAEGWQLVDGEKGKSLLVGNERWPFPVPLVNDAGGWRFDTAAGREEILARRIGRNELVAIGVCRRYVAAQHRYAEQGHDGQPAGRYATKLRSDPLRQNGLYWPAGRWDERSPLGDLIANASAEGPAAGAADSGPSPFHGYYFRILTRQGADATGGPRDYMVNGEMSGGFGLVAWPAQYDVTGIMTFVVNQDGIVREKDLGPATHTMVERMTAYNPHASWAASLEQR
jgi:hypothetical protein